MRMMKKSVSLLLCLVMLISVFTILPIVSASADGTRTIHVGIINYLIDECGSTGWQVHYWDGADGANLTDTGETIDHSVGYWDSAQSFKVFTAEIPSEAKGYKVRIGGRYFGDDGNTDDSDVAYVFNYDGDKAVYAKYVTPGVYLLGSMNGWTIDPSYLLTEDPSNAGTYFYEYITLAAGAEFKVVDHNGYDGSWYPASNYVVTTAGVYNIKFNASNEIPVELLPVFAGHSLTLNGDIGVNFYLNLTAAQAANATVDFAWNEKTKNNVSVALATDGSGRYVATCNVAAAEMTCPITATLKNSGTAVTTDTYSVKQYADQILTPAYEAGYVAPSEAKSYENLSALVRAMLDYGTAAQTQFGVNTEVLANGGTYVDGFAGTTIDGFAYNEAYESLDGSGITFEGASLALNSETTLLLAFKGNVEFAFNEFFDVTGPVDNNGYKIVKVTDIPAAQVGSRITVTLNGGAYSVGYCPLTYCHNVLAHPEDYTDTEGLKLVDTVKALYLYVFAARGYFAEV